MASTHGSLHNTGPRIGLYGAPVGDGHDQYDVVLTGIATSGVVLSALRAAADMDYWLTVLADCCADADAEVHRVLTTKVFPRQSEVLTAAEWGMVCKRSLHG